jgi:hypothetical protein
VGGGDSSDRVTGGLINCGGSAGGRRRRRRRRRREKAVILNKGSTESFNRKMVWLET